MDYKGFTKREFMDILGIIQFAMVSKNETHIKKLLGRVRDLVCADNCICAVGEADSGRLIKIVNLDYPEEWESIYTANKYYKKDPVIHYNFRFFMPHFWSEALKIFSEKPYVDLMNMSSEFGLKYGLANGMRGIEESSIFSFSGNTNRFEDHHKKILEILTPHLHQALARICGGHNIDIHLSAREIEVLKWAKEGKTNWEISIILNISENTVKFHILNIQRELNAVNKAHAVAIAMAQGVIG